MDVLPFYPIQKKGLKNNLEDNINSKQKTKVLAVVGPTASGKSDLGVYLAKRLNGEIISADSMQIYKELSIGTAKPTKEQRKVVKHHLIDFVPLDVSFSVADYLKEAKTAISDINERDALPILVGGTGQYIDALVDGLSFSTESSNSNVRQELQLELERKGEEALWRKLYLIDSAYARTLHYRNSKRVLRGIEIFLNTGVTMTEQLKKNRQNKSDEYDFLIIGIDWKEREQLYRRIDLRVDKMMELGLLDEARKVYNDPRKLPTVRQAIGYKEFFPYFEGQISLEEAIDILKRQTRRYAKRQLTWFRRNTKINWFYLDEKDDITEVYNQIYLFVKNMEFNSN